jgi:glutaconyl-CoA/methylmalonyl-CoA decarboxylase subunit delta
MDDLLFGLQVTVVGMGIVFGLLALLWLLLTLVLRLEQRGRPEGAAEAVATAAALAPAIDELPAVEPSGSPAVRLVGAPADLDPGLLAAIGVVILRHADTRRRQAAPAMRTNWPGSLLFASRWVAAGRARQARSWTRRGR